MRKKYIEDNDEQDPALIEKVAPYYQHTSQVLGGTQLSFVVCGAVFGVSIFSARIGRLLDRDNPDPGLACACRTASDSGGADMGDQHEPPPLPSDRHAGALPDQEVLQVEKHTASERSQFHVYRR